MRVYPMVRWIRIRAIGGEWVTVNVNAISHVEPAGYGLGINTVSGSKLLLLPREGRRVMRKLMAAGVIV